MDSVHPLVHVNAALNATATLLLILGFVLIKQRRETAHMWVMGAAFDVSVAFLICYLWYHYTAGHVPFGGTGAVRYVYFFILVSHIILAMTVPPLAIGTIYFGLRATGYWPSRSENGQQEEIQPRYRAKHRQLARWTFPIWLYVSVTGVIVYFMLYHLWPPVVG